MHFLKKSYDIMKQTVRCKVGLKVKNCEGRDIGALHHKVWKPGRLKPIINDDSKDQGQFQTKVWDPGRQRLKVHD